MTLLKQAGVDAVKPCFKIGPLTQTCPDDAPKFILRTSRRKSKRVKLLFTSHKPAGKGSRLQRVNDKTSAQHEHNPLTSLFQEQMTSRRTCCASLWALRTAGLLFFLAPALLRDVICSTQSERSSEINN